MYELILKSHLGNPERETMEAWRDELYHHGIKGQQWGVQHGPPYPLDGKTHDFILKKNQIIKRVSTSRFDPTYDNKKYVSIDQEDQDAWEEYLGEAYVKRNAATYVQTYALTNDVKVASSQKQGEIFVESFLTGPLKSKTLSDIEYSNDFLGVKPSDNDAENASRIVAAQTETGKKFAEKMMSLGYQAVLDTHGTNVSKNPVIVFNPDENLRRAEEPYYTKPVEDYFRRMWFS